MDPERIMNCVDKQLILDLSKEFIETPSPTGHEADFARVVYRALKEVGMDAQLQMLYEDRFNAAGRVYGDGTGPTVMFSGHLDTSVSGDEDWLTGPGYKNKCVIVDDKWIYGNGIYNMKGALVCYIAAVDALLRSGYKLKGDIIIAGTAGEIEKAAIDEFQGREYDSYGVGLRYLMIHGYAADYHILGEPTGNLPQIGRMGTVWAKITVHGAFSHSAFADRTLSAIEEMWKLWRGLDPWIENFRKNTFMGVYPQVNRAAIRGGLPWRAARTPNTCSMYVDLRFPPDRYPIDIQREFKAEVLKIAERELKKPIEITFYMSRPGTLIPRDHPLVSTVIEAHKIVTGLDVKPILKPACSDCIDANRLGILTIEYGPGNRTRQMGDDKYMPIDRPLEDPRVLEGEYVFLDDMVTCSQVYALSAMKLTNMDLETVKKHRYTMPGVNGLPFNG